MASQNRSLRSCQKRKEPLYEADGKEIFYNDFAKALKAVGIRKGDSIFVHSDISSFGKLKSFDRDFLMGMLLSSLSESVGKEGTIIMPTFTYSFDKNEPYDVANTRSAVGTLTEYFRHQPGVARTIHPSHSAAVWGKRKKEFLNIGKGTFDEDSIFGKLHRANGKLVFFGTPLSKSCTYIHYIERLHAVPYRYLRKYRARIINGSRDYEDDFWFYYKYSFFYTSMERLEKHLRENGLLKEAAVGNGKIAAIGADELFKEGCRLLDKDIYFFLKNEPFIFRLFNVSIYPFLKYAPWVVKLVDSATSKVLR
jgi:aminoglycoside 3-N-acetyltransferase